MQIMKHFALTLLALSFSTAALAGHHSTHPSSADVSAWQPNRPPSGGRRTIAGWTTG
jgi:hypothetical protein